MKLALIRRQFSATGGAELYLQRLLQALADKGHVSNATITNHQKGMFLTNVSLFGRKEMAKVRGSRLDEVSERVAR